MTTQIFFTEDAIADLRRIGPDTVPRILAKIRILQRNPQAGQPLSGRLTGFRKLVVGRNTWRVVYRLVATPPENRTAGAAPVRIEICEIWAVGARRDAEVYAEAARRARQAAEREPGMAPLADLIGRLAKAVGEAGTTGAPPPRAPVPDWLADRLVHTAGLRPERVAALGLEQAVDAWAEYRLTGAPPARFRETPRP